MEKEVFFKVFSAFNHVKYFDDKHKYYIGNKELISTTTFIGKFKKPFDTNYWATKKAIERGVSKEQILLEWTDIKDTACAKGSDLHSYSDNYFHNRVFPTGVSDNLINQFKNFYKKFVSNNLVIRTEYVLADEDLGIAGMIDLFCYNKKKNEFYIADYKTNKKFEFESKFNNYYLEPISHLSECEFNTYSLQTSIYRYIIEKNLGIELGDSIVIWFNEKNQDYEAIKCEYMKKEVETMFNYYKKNKK
jgi:ATP-dependent exoDNAse (exonuclease V) beta subunit